MLRSYGLQVLRQALVEGPELHLQAGHKIVVDTTLRLGHVGSYTYGWEDAGQAVPRVTGARFRYGPGGVVDE